MTEFNGRLTDSGQVVTDQVIPFSKIKGGWIQDSKTAWQRLIVPSGDDQVVELDEYGQLLSRQRSRCFESPSNV